jgi:DNA-binding transcriptional ArsR family regulator
LTGNQKVAYDCHVDSIFNALGDPTRVAIVEELAVRDRQSLFELCTRLLDSYGLGMSRQAIAKHIGVLKDAGIVTVEYIGRTSVHSLDRDALRRGHEWLSALTQREDPT